MEYPERGEPGITVHGGRRTEPSVEGASGIAASEPCPGFADADVELIVVLDVGGVMLGDVEDGGGVEGKLGIVEGGYVEGEGARHGACRGRRQERAGGRRSGC